MNSIDRLYEELDQWNFLGEEAVLWWRDDDAQAETPALSRLIDLSSSFQVPLALAAIPDGVESSLIEALKGKQYISVIQHGYTHNNHAPSDQKKQELGDHRPVDEIMTELEKGFHQLESQFPEHFHPVLVPPWNRISEELFNGLVRMGFRGLSTFKPRKDSEPEPELWVVNTHADIIHWKEDKRFIGGDQVVDQLINHLWGKRMNDYDPREPTGLLTHHLVHDEDSWSFLKVLLSALDEHPAVKWVDAQSAFQLRWR